MSFVSNEFLLFLLATWVLFVACRPSYRVPLLIGASFVFYATWSIPFIGVILLTTTVDYLASKAIYTNSSRDFRKAAMFGAIAVNLAVLAFFKYFNFFLDANFQLLSILGLNSPLPRHMEILLPLGISYYTFEAISYVVDVYRGGKPAPTWWDYSFYIMYFPHLISGPIVRFKELWSQYSLPIELPSLKRLGKGLELIVLGYLFKIAFANNAALLSDPLYANPMKHTALETYIAVLAFAVQLYFDFMGYTHIARGVSLLFNIELPLNFNHPYNANSLANFWQRWQISLSRWLHDYVFVPLGGARKSLSRTMLAVFLTLLIAGIWHGAGWTYVVLGAYYGSLVALYHGYRRFRRSILGPREREIVQFPVYKCVMYSLTFASIIFSSVLFRAPSVKTQFMVAAQLTRIGDLSSELLRSLAMGNLTPLALLIILMLCLISGPSVAAIYDRLFRPLPYWLKWHTATAAVIVCWIFCAIDTPPFIYFQF